VRAGALILTVAALIAVLLIAGRFYLSDQSFSPANPSWNGITGLTMGNGAKPLYSFADLGQAVGDDTLVVIGPTANFTAAEARQVSDFIIQGGRLIVMDDHGTANCLLDNISSSIVLGHVPLCQDIDFYKNASLPVIGNIANESITENVHTLTLNHPVALQITGNAHQLASTTARAWLDVNDNAKIDGDETFGTYPVIARESRGGGEIIVAADADLVINSMLDKGDNGILLANIIRDGTVYVDVGHGQQVPPLASLYYIVKYNLAAQIICALIALIIGYAYIIRGRIFRRSGNGQAPEETPPDPKQSLMSGMRKLPLTEREMQELNKKM